METHWCSGRSARGRRVESGRRRVSRRCELLQFAGRSSRSAERDAHAHHGRRLSAQPLASPLVRAHIIATSVEPSNQTMVCHMVVRMRLPSMLVIGFLAIGIVSLPGTIRAQTATAAQAIARTTLDPALYATLRYRHVGPVGNRVSSVAGVTGDPLTYYAGAASGGIWKTT